MLLPRQIPQTRLVSLCHPFSTHNPIQKLSNYIRDPHPCGGRWEIDEWRYGDENTPFPILNEVQ